MQILEVDRKEMDYARNSYCGNYKPCRYTISQRRTTALITYRLEQLEKKVEKHNQLQDRMVVVEQSVKSAHHRIDELREDVEEGGKE